MDDLQKILVSGAAGGSIGFITGIAIEPVKLWFQEWHKVRRIRSAVMKEIAVNYIKLRAFLEKIESEPTIYPGDLPFLNTTLCEEAQKDTFIFAQIEPSDWIGCTYGGFYYVNALLIKTAPLKPETIKEYVWKSKAACKQVEVFNGGSWSEASDIVQHIPRHLWRNFKYYVERGH